MAKRANSNKGWIFGTVLGAVAGAAYALYKTPMSGQELRSKMTPGPLTTSNGTAAPSGGGITGKVMSTIEHTLAPLVGVELGKTANGTSATSTYADTEPIAVAAAPGTEQAANVAGSDKLRSNRFAWGSPTPNATEGESAPSVPESAPVAANLPEAAPEPDPAPVAAASADESKSWSNDKISSKRFAWGDPAPDAAAMPAAASAPVEPVADSTVSTAEDISAEAAPAGNVADAVMASASAVSTGKMNTFPQLGGLEDNA